ncbi:MAG: hypothetical protein ACYDG6_10420 [Thermincolia bacterium]
MFDLESYYRLLSVISGALVTLLGSVGIFISLIIQRRVERLQDILEEFMDLSYREDSNLTGKMYKLIEKYQMHYLMPDTPSRTILVYINSTISIVLISWITMAVLNFRLPFRGEALFMILPITAGLVVMIFFRNLLRNFISPINKPLLSPIIPPPTMLRSVSYLSRYINVSVKSILKQARLSLVIRLLESDGQAEAEVVLKEELSFDDFFYYLYLEDGKNICFLSFGEIKYLFAPDSITRKPVPIERNVNIPLGRCLVSSLPEKDFNGQLLIFPRAEKHPIHYTYRFHWEERVIRPAAAPEVKINHLITYQVAHGSIHIIEDKQKTPGLLRMAPHFRLNHRRFYLKVADLDSQPEECSQPVYIS